MEDDVAVLELSGELKLGPSLFSLEKEARQSLNGNKVKGLILDVGSITRADSSGLGQLTIVSTVASRKNCPIRLINVKPQLKSLLELTHLDRILPSSPDLASALAELKKK